MEIKFEHIERIIVSQEVIDRNTIKISFKASNQAVSIETLAFIPSPSILPTQSKAQKRKLKKSGTVAYFISQESRQKAIVEAFRRLSVFYEFDAESQQWKYKSPLS